MNELQEPWKTAGEQKGITSYRSIARASGLAVETVRKVLRGERRPSAETATRLGAAFGVDRPTVDAWVGMTTGEDNEDYTPPAEARRLNRRQRRALDEIIRSMVHTAPLTNNVPLPQDAFDLAASKGPNRGRAEKEAANALGEESQESPE